MKTAFCYHRYSTDSQKNGYSLEVQRNLTKKLAEKYECTIVGIYEDEGISGATIDKRPSMLSLLNDIKSQKPDYIICVDQDRIARGNDFWYIKNLMDKHGASFITEKEGIIRFEDASSDFMSDIIAAAAKYERGMVKQRIKRAISERYSKGLKVGNLTNVTGYDYSGGNITINEREAETVRKIFDLCCEGKGPLSIALQLNSTGASSKTGGPFTAKRVRLIITNPLYCGYVRHENKLIKGLHEPIIKEDIFEHANESLKRYRKYNTTKPSRYLLTGFLKCGSCGANLGGCYKYLDSKNRYYTYRCIGYHRGKCTKPVYIEKNKIESYIIDTVIKKLKSLSLSFEKRIPDIRKELGSGAKDVSRKRERLHEKGDRLLDSYLDGYISKEKYRRYARDINRQLLELKSARRAETDFDFLKDVEISKVFRESSIEDQRNMIALIIDKVIVSRADRNYKIRKRIKIFWNDIV